MKIDPQLKEELKKYIIEREYKLKRKVTITSAYALTEKEMDILKTNLPVLKEAVVDNLIDRDLVAGVVIRFGTKMIDLSLKGELQSLLKLIYDIT